MGATLDETRLELEAQRARVRRTAGDLETEVRRALDPRSLIRRHPGQTAAVAAGLAFVLLGGPRRTVRFVRRSLTSAADGDRAYAALPGALRTLVDETAPGFGESKAQAKREMALAVQAWRADPKNRKKADRLVSMTLTPPGPERAFWSVVETVAVAGAAVVARGFIADRIRVFLGSKTAPPRPGAGTEPPSSSSAPQGRVAAPSGPADTGYAGWSGRRPSVAGPAREDTAAPKPPAKPTAPAKPTTPTRTGS
ncbi:MAG TPA: hypothetical protein VIA02_06740 [Candidatus Limnocylindria bacterium]